MPDYRVYVVNEKGRVVGVPRVITCDDDDEAIEQAKPLISGVLDGHFIELWDGARTVGRVPKVA